MGSTTGAALIATCLILCSCSEDRRVASGSTKQPGDPTAGFTLKWRLVDAAAVDPTRAPPIACAAAQITQVRLAAHNRDTNEDFAWTFSCDAGQGVSPNVTVGTYTISVDALDAGGGARSTDTWPFDNTDGGNLGLVIFPVSLSG